MVFETIKDKGERPWLYAAAIGMMGLPIARVAEGVLAKLSGTGPQVLPSEQPVRQLIEPEKSEERTGNES